MNCVTSFLNLFFQLSVLCYLTKASLIEFNGTPTDVKEGLTSNLTLRCGLKDSPVAGAIVGKRDVSQTVNDVAEVMSLVVMKDGKDVASVSHSDPARVMDGSRNIHVSGSVSAKAGGQGFLQLTLEDPDKNQTGEFVCEVNAISHSGHVVTFSSSLEISSSTPTTADLIQYIRQVNREKEDMRKEEQGMKQAISDLQKKELLMENEVSELRKKADTVVLFSAALTKSITLSTAGQVLVYDKVLQNVGGGYNSVTGAFVCTVPGYYLFEMSALSAYNKYFHLALFQNDKDIVHFHGSSDNAHQGNAQMQILKLAKGDVVKVKTYSTSYIFGTATDIHTTFTGLLVATV